jgi:hypothetical protein
MTADEVIEQIKALPPIEQQRVIAYVRESDQLSLRETEKSVRYTDAKAAKAAGDKVVAQYTDVFRRLSQ